MVKKSCPFCGSDNLDFSVINSQDKEGYPTAIVCTDCGCHGPWTYVSNFDENNDNIWKLWNERHPNGFDKSNKPKITQCKNCKHSHPLSNIEKYSSDNFVYCELYKRVSYHMLICDNWEPTFEYIRNELNMKE